MTTGKARQQVRLDNRWTVRDSPKTTEVWKEGCGSCGIAGKDLETISVVCAVPLRPLLLAVVLTKEKRGGSDSKRGEDVETAIMVSMRGSDGYTLLVRVDLESDLI